MALKPEVQDSGPTKRTDVLQKFLNYISILPLTSGIEIFNIIFAKMVDLC